ncbi:putative signal transduction protein [Alkalidesulfovibrio alkalitolerans DSM 16529]|uniref:histidine kinase n=1 Tax=Alkalidesulfovibrio alkalitolerans DSM 16529 TaxID=1121439 RepID=S7UJD2_9BACT|nr:HDOD domain-containing protein [Alkalidesulfovibrio alkalitolerans]EPR32413.1 putative signal transduction protein [Alkalidesulfovibrio alkalitolerans DSM 16529]
MAQPISAPPIPSLSPHETRLVILCFDPSATARELVETLARDEQAVSLFLKAARGNAFGFGGAPATLPQAVVRTGFAFARKWAAVHALSRRMHEITGRPPGVNEYWRRALCRSVVADALEDYFAPCACGQAALLGFLLEAGGLLAPSEPSPEKRYALSARMLRAWGLPGHAIQVLEEAAKGPATPLSSPTRRFLHVADLFSDLCFGEREDIHAFLLTAQELLDADEALVEDLVIASLQTLRGVAEHILMDADARQGLNELLGKATRVFRDMLREAAPAPLPSRETLDVAVARDTLEAMAHELRNPLMAVGGFARKLVGALDATSPEHEYASIILEEGRRIEELFRGMEENP